MKKELFRLEQDNIDLIKQQMGMNKSLELSEMVQNVRQQLEEEITDIHREKKEVTEQLHYITILKDQLSTEKNNCQIHISRCARADDEIQKLRSSMEFLLSNVTLDGLFDPLCMSETENETRKLDVYLEFRGSYKTQPRRRTSPNRSTMKYSNRLTSTPAMRRIQSPIALRKKMLK
ncbi:Hypothetical predicted protein [Mytilus galloprovincialis]|uniref:Uncharacterized protein n=1 Tax=Mytilus galloprovincialis TaxID=29158 RepID=A0A8B6ELB5_MYTGA|nr:Hypothetical predicted protein [Mytilus galloprovincialis]